jgi:hypothetical protein
MTKFRQNTAMEDYLAYTISLLLLILMAIAAYTALKHFDTKRQAREFATKQAAIESRYEKEQSEMVDYLILEKKHFEAQDQGFHHIPSIHYNE